LVLFAISLIIHFFFFKGVSSVFAGSESGNQDGVGTNARFNLPYGIAIDQQSGTLFVSDQSNHNIRMITPQGKSFLLSSEIHDDFILFKEKC
jgi:hypothetical protein